MVRKMLGKPGGENRDISSTEANISSIVSPSDWNIWTIHI